MFYINANAFRARLQGLRKTWQKEHTARGDH